MPMLTYDARIRGSIAFIVVGVFFLVPVFVVLAIFAGFLSSKDLKPMLEPWALYMGPLTGAVFGYYFGSSESHKDRAVADAQPKSSTEE